MSVGRATSAELVEGVRRVVAGTGLELDGVHGRRVVAAAAAAMEACGADEVSQLAVRLSADPALVERLLDDVTVSETYFLREPGHFQLLAAVAADRRAEDRPLRVWSAGCASGEEAYSVAITLDELGVLDRARIIGTDLTEHSIAQARRGVYRSWSLRRCTEDQRARWFERTGDRFRLRDRYRRSVEWRRGGLLAGAPTAPFDVVLCRNVLIYFTEDAIREAAVVLHDALAPDGWLLLGAADPQLRHPGLAPVRTEHGIAYRRVPVGSAASATQGAQAPDRPRSAGRRTAPPSRRCTSGVDGSSVRQLDPRAGRSMSDDDDEDLDATARCRSAARQLEDGRLREAAVEAAAALYLDPTLVAAHLVVGQAEEHAGDHVAASRRYRNALALLAELDPAAPVPLLEEPAGQLALGVLDRISSLHASS